MKVKAIHIYEVNGGQKVLILTIEPEKPEATKEELTEVIGELLEMFYSYDKIKLPNKKFQGVVIRGGEHKTFIVEAEIIEE